MTPVRPAETYHPPNCEDLTQLSLASLVASSFLVCWAPLKAWKTAPQRVAPSRARHRSCRLGPSKEVTCAPCPALLVWTDLMAPAGLDCELCADRRGKHCRPSAVKPRMPVCSVPPSRACVTAARTKPKPPRRKLHAGTFSLWLSLRRHADWPAHSVLNAVLASQAHRMCKRSNSEHR